ncbi:MAG: ribonuclease D [Alteromonadaceae bacterium]|nr:ribonuclease D [Alteromonadaceae bacterium]|tara:strand:+ start:650 stop:1825 length:1176 start_codon:yes stop_codon:yes gene_type:complete
MVLKTPPIPEPGEHLWLREPAELDAWIAAVPDGTPVAIDSEFERTSTFFAIPGLVQIATEDSARLVEPAAVEGSAAFRTWLGDATQPKWLYAMSEDIELFREWLGESVAGALDIQIAAALAGEGMSVGYARLVEALFGVALGKEETRSDWLRRPLSEAQQRYALADVLYLIPMAGYLLERLDQLGLKTALAEESDRFVHDLQNQSSPERYYLRLRGGWRLSRSQQDALQALCEWREKEARKRDKPRSRLVSDKMLLEVAGRMPTELGHFSGLRELNPVVVRKHGEAMLACIEGSRQRSEPLASYIDGPLTQREQTVYSEVKGLVQQCCESGSIPPEFFAPRKKLEAAVREGIQQQSVPELLASGWRGELLQRCMPDLQRIFQSSSKSTQAQ